MLGHPASSQTVCRPSRRTRDFSSVYSGPVRSRVLIHAGLRSMGTSLLRTSRRRSLRALGPTGAPEGDTAVSLTATRYSAAVPTPSGSGRVLGVERLLAAVGQRRAALAHRAVHGVRGVAGRRLAARALGRTGRTGRRGAQRGVTRAGRSLTGRVRPVLRAFP